MPWITPRAKAIFERIASALESSLLVLRPEADPRKVSLAVRSSAGVFSQILRAVSPEIRELHDNQSWWGRQNMHDSDDDESMNRRNSYIWGRDGRPSIVACR